MITCALFICMLQTPSAIPERLNFRIEDTRTHEVLTVEWVSPDVTKNVQGADCWLYDGTATSSCAALSQVSKDLALSAQVL